MPIENEIMAFSNENEKFSYSFLFHSTNSEDIISTLNKKLENINKKMNNAFKKKNVNDRIYSLISNMESRFQPTEIVNGIFFVNTKINFIPFLKENMNHINTWNITKFFMEFDDKFMTEYFVELFSTKKIKTVFKFDKSSYDVISIDSTKSRKLESHSSMDESHITENVSKHKPVMIYGLNQTLKKLNFDDIIIQLKNLTKEEVCEIISKKEIEDNMLEFKTEILDMIPVEAVSDKFVFGRKEIGEAIENYMVKKLFINSKLLSILKSKADSSLLNFTIVEIKSLQPGDPGNILNRDYFGMIAVRYY